MGKIVAERLITGLVETGRFAVIERLLLEKLPEEQRLGATGVIDPSSTAQLGKILGVKTIVARTVTNSRAIRRSTLGSSTWTRPRSSP
jgi:curli biogenesis system outer membrane secretion channel CsgG